MALPSDYVNIAGLVQLADIQMAHSPPQDTGTPVTVLWKNIIVLETSWLLESV